MTADVTPATGQALELGEGVRLVDDRLVLVDILQGSLYEHPGRTDGELTRLHSVDVPLGAVAPVRGRPGTWIVAAGEGVGLLDESGIDWIARPESHHEGATRMNDGVCDPAGRFWAGSMAYDSESPLGSLYRVDPDGTVRQVLDGIAIANGPAFSPDGRRMYLADSAAGTVTRYDVSPDGVLGPGELVWQEPTGASPDGMTVDAEGNLWSAIWGAARVRRLSPEGELLLDVPLPAKQPTSVAVVGPRLFVTSARTGLEHPGPADGLLLAVDLPADARTRPIPAHAWG